MEEVEVKRMKLTQIQMFHTSDEPLRTIETRVNAWLEANCDRIVVKDIKHHPYCTPNPNAYYVCDDIMIIFEAIEDP